DSEPPLSHSHNLPPTQRLSQGSTHRPPALPCPQEPPCCRGEAGAASPPWPDPRWDRHGDSMGTASLWAQGGQQHLVLPPQGKHYQCSSYGCKLAFHSMQELMDHLKVHYRPTQSLEGKTFHCPTLGCSETFPSMQDLMSHMKVHYKPNRYFKCENCLLRFRTHRSLFKHLHVCSDSASKAMLPGTDTAAAAAAGLHGSLEAAPLVSPATHPFPLLEPNPFGPSSLTRFSGPPHSSGPGPFVSYVHPSSYSLPQASLQHRLRPYVPGQGLPVSNAVWKKSQGETMAPRRAQLLLPPASSSTRTHRSPPAAKELPGSQR
uniref:Zinc finger protein 414 n=1 Tax=Nothoprocta perdicaria TaxID=30464 RepID=A0A8C6ZS27_NOTPE